MHVLPFSWIVFGKMTLVIFLNNFQRHILIGEVSKGGFRKSPQQPRRTYSELFVVLKNTLFEYHSTLIQSTYMVQHLFHADTDKTEFCTNTAISMRGGSHELDMCIQ